MKDKNQDEDNIDDVTFVESTEEGGELLSKDKIKKIKNDLKLCQKEKEEYLIGWQRAKADYINLQKEIEQIRLNSSVLVKENLILNLLPALDSFEMAFANKDSWEKVDKEWRLGVEYIHQQLMTGINNFGISKINELNVPFDPQIHHSVKMVKTNEKENNHLIASISQVGYKIGDRIIRPASVDVYEYENSTD
ncbi:MAG: nucleotide exchange factor GrpE [Candidatus Pacebacteria bacterium]|nr:nucleotide exchange factor GrpE [Candidatus Paceibacterota bacterium]